MSRECINLAIMETILSKTEGCTKEISLGLRQNTMYYLTAEKFGTQSSVCSAYYITGKNVQSRRFIAVFGTHITKNHVFGIEGCNKNGV